MQGAPQAIPPTKAVLEGRGANKLRIHGSVETQELQKDIDRCPQGVTLENKE